MATLRSFSLIAILIAVGACGSGSEAPSASPTAPSQAPSEAPPTPPATPTLPQDVRCSSVDASNANGQAACRAQAGCMVVTGHPVDARAQCVGPGVSACRDASPCRDVITTCRTSAGVFQFGDDCTFEACAPEPGGRDLPPCGASSADS